MIRTELERRFPLPDASRADWEDALSRAGIPRSRRRPLVGAAFAALVVAITVAATPLGAGLTNAVGEFSHWLTGKPGTTAPTAEQHAFERWLRGEWFAFPKRPELRTLLHSRVGTTDYRLYGFRSGDAICLRLSVRWREREGSSLNCVSRAELERSRDLLVTVKANVRFGRVGPRHLPRAVATFGFVADHVRDVSLATDRRTTPARVRSGAFLNVLKRPLRGEWVRAALARDDRGRRQRLQIVVIGGGVPAAGSQRARGPAGIEREVTDGTIQWFVRREPRGEPVSPDLRRVLGGPGLEIGDFARIVEADPNDFRRTILAERAGRPDEFCEFALPGGGGSCGAVAGLFAVTPLRLSWTTGRDEQFWIVQGLASDDVARVDAFLATAERRPLALANNVVAGQIPAAKLPARIVGYDARGRVISVTKIPILPRRPRVRPVVSTFRTLIRARPANGAAAALRVAHSTAGGECFEVRAGEAVGAAGCYGTRWRGPALQLAVQGRGLGWFIYGRVRSSVNSLEIHYEDEDITSTRAVDGYVLYAIPTGHARDEHRATVVVGFDRDGGEIGRQDFRRR
jgi:hypothetical protein